MNTTQIRAAITGTGSYLPERTLTNDDLSKMVDTSDEWIYPRTGIRSRRIAAKGQFTSDMAVAAGRDAIAAASLKPEDIDLLVLATITGDQPMPATACHVQAALGLVNATAFDISAACSGFIYALEIARQFVLSGSKKKVLVIGAEKMSHVVDWTDRTTCILFGDGAGAAVVEPSTSGNGILAAETGTDGSLAPLLFIESGGCRVPSSPEALEAHKQYLKMDGHTIFKHAVRNMSHVAQKAIADAGLQASDIDWIVPHQANLRIISAVAKQVGIPEDRAILTIEYTGNTTAASIPLALHSGVADGRIKPGQNLLFVAFGAGLTWGATVIRWGK